MIYHITFCMRQNATQTIARTQGFPQAYTLMVCSGMRDGWANIEQWQGKQCPGNQMAGLTHTHTNTRTHIWQCPSNLNSCWRKRKIFQGETEWEACFKAEISSSHLSSSLSWSEHLSLPPVNQDFRLFLTFLLSLSFSFVLSSLLLFLTVTEVTDPHVFRCNQM